MARITVHMGHFGSGKTEISLFEALKLAASGVRTVLVDADIVNPYFRSGHQRKALEEAGVRVIAPLVDGVLPADIFSVFTDQSCKVVMDAGGDPVGATALGQYRNYFLENDVQTVCVVNALRPFTTTPGDVVQMVRDLEACSRIPIQAFVNNTNLTYETTAEHVMQGQVIVEAAAQMLQIPVMGIYAVPKVLRSLPDVWADRYAALMHPLNLFNQPLWQQGEWKQV